MSKHKKVRDDDDKNSLEYDRLKHLEMIQAVVARLANEAALIRGWALTVSAAFFGFAAQSYSWRIAAVGLMPVVAFWGLNSYYLRTERQYRALYEQVRKHAVNDPYLMNANNQDVETRLKTIFSLTLWPFYGVILLVGVVIMIAGIFKLGDSTIHGAQTYFLN
jgi:hypothetical protein